MNNFACSRWLTEFPQSPHIDPADPSWFYFASIDGTNIKAKSLGDAYMIFQDQDRTHIPDNDLYNAVLDGKLSLYPHPILKMPKITRGIVRVGHRGDFVRSLELVMATLAPSSNEEEGEDDGEESEESEQFMTPAGSASGILRSGSRAASSSSHAAPATLATVKQSPLSTAVTARTDSIKAQIKQLEDGKKRVTKTCTEAKAGLNIFLNSVFSEYRDQHANAGAIRRASDLHEWPTWEDIFDGEQNLHPHSQKKHPERRIPVSSQHSLANKTLPKPFQRNEEKVPAAPQQR
jgi:hypothetical protein